MKPSGADNLIGEQNILKKQLEQDKSNTMIEAKIRLLEENISEILAEEEMNKIIQFKQFSMTYASVSISEMWKLKKQLWPKKNQSIPTGKIYHQ